MMNNTTQDYVLITATNFPSGGAGANYLNLFCRGMKLAGGSIRVFLLKGHAFGNQLNTGPRKNITVDGIPFAYLGMRQRPENPFLKLVDQGLSFIRLVRLLFSLAGKRGSVTILLYNSDLFFNLPIYLFAKISGIRIIKFVAEIIDKSQFRKSLLGRISRAAYMSNFKYLNKFSDKLIVFSHFLADEFTAMGYNPDNIIIQPNLTDFEYWNPENNDIKYDLGYSGAPYKKDGLSDLLAAMRILNEDGLKLTLLIAGDATFGKSLIPDLKRECERLDLVKNVTFTGLINSAGVKEYLSACRILTVTRPDTVQTRAGFPTKIGEYFAMNKPVLATRFGDLERYFTDGSDIIMAECGRPESIAQKIKWMMQNDRELEAITLRGYNTAKHLLEFKSSMSRIMNILNRS